MRSPVLTPCAPAGASMSAPPIEARTTPAKFSLLGRARQMRYAARGMRGVVSPEMNADLAGVSHRKPAGVPGGVMSKREASVAPAGPGPAPAAQNWRGARPRRRKDDPGRGRAGKKQGRAP